MFAVKVRIQFFKKNKSCTVEPSFAALYAGVFFTLSTLPAVRVRLFPIQRWAGSLFFLNQNPVHLCSSCIIKKRITSMLLHFLSKWRADHELCSCSQESRSFPVQINSHHHLLQVDSSVSRCVSWSTQWLCWTLIFFTRLCQFESH